VCCTSVTVGSLPLTKLCGEGAANTAFSCRLINLQFTWGTAYPPLSCGACCMSATVTSLPLSKLSWGGSANPAFFGRLVYLQVHPPQFQSSGRTALFATSFFNCLLIIQFFFFAGWGSVCPGSYADLSQGCLWEYHLPLICSPVGLCLPSRLGAGDWQHRSPPVFSVYGGLGNLCVGCGCEVSEFYLFLVVFPARCVSSVSTRFLL
jgi:hypothetical protein